ncbi:DUF3800 domain-containing protein [Sinorhizobium fredii]|uniref:DUF3800 domain-containing protein n=1 Tax=Rhizobium fredii TaxID=380 RepID=UPI000684D2B4|nr:DUF3800 domain-containing protein [Sinorhizobium fredii]
MIFAYLDEFGHAGPYFGKDHTRHNASPVFGLAGILLPENAVRPFATRFLKRKNELLEVEIQRAGKQGYEWEKKGTNLFTAASVDRYPAVRNSMLRLINEIRNSQGKIFYCGREKIRNTEDVRANGLYTTVFANALRQINSYCESINDNFVLIVDEHSSRKELLETAAKTMFGANPVKRLLSPPFEVESYLNQNMQAADWIATIIGRLWNYKLEPEDFKAYASYEKYYWGRVHSVATHSSVMQRPKQQNCATVLPIKEQELGSLGLKLQEALSIRTVTTVVEEGRSA